MRGRLASGRRVPVTASPAHLEMPQPEHQPPVAAARSPRADGAVVAAAVALLEAAALTAAMRQVASWNPLLHLYAAADRRWHRQPTKAKGLAHRPEQAGDRVPSGGAGCGGHDRPVLGRGRLPERPAAVGGPAPGCGLACRWRSVRPLVTTSVGGTLQSKGRVGVEGGSGGPAGTHQAAPGLGDLHADRHQGPFTRPNEGGHVLDRAMTVAARGMSGATLAQRRLLGARAPPSRSM
jgi:hypothetical protein